MKLLVLIGCLLASTFCRADDYVSKWQVSATSTYVVAAVLRKNDEATTVRLVQGIETASSADEAIGAFSRHAQQSLPGYSVMDVVIVRVNQTTNCGTSI